MDKMKPLGAIGMAFDPVTAVNLVLCAIIVALGYFGYVKSKDNVPLYIGAAFSLFGISHLVNLVGVAGTTEILIVVRTLGYLTVIGALYSLWAHKYRKSRL